MEGYGFPLVDGLFPLWPENDAVFDAFITIRTQWRTGANGATGLDYLAVTHTLKELGFKKRKMLLQGIRAMETQILSDWSEERSKLK